MLRARSSVTPVCGGVTAGILIVTAIALCAPAYAGPIPLAIPGGGPAPGNGPGAGSPGAAVARGGAETAGARVMVAVIKAADADPAAREIVTRIVAELVADGVSVVALTCPTADTACLGESGARVSAVVLVQSRDNARAVEVHSSEPAPTGGLVHANTFVAGHRVQRVADAGGGGGPAVLAVRTVEMLRAMLTDESAPATSASPAPVPQVVARVAPDSDEDVGAPPPPRLVVPMGPFNVTMAVGGAMFAGFHGLNAAFGPAFSIGRRTSEHVLLSLAFAGLAFAPEQGNSAGTVSVRHDMAAVQADVLGLLLRRVVWRVGLGAGVYHVAIEGHPSSLAAAPSLQETVAPSTESGRNTGAFAGLLSWSAGLGFNIRPHLSVFLDGRLFVLTQTPVVLLSGLEVGRVGNPQLCLTSGLEFRL